MKKLKFQRPTGMHDILPEDQRYFQKIYNVCEAVVNFYGFKKIDTPILEDTALYEKGTGLTTDIVQKQMFTLRTRGGDYLTLRPEFTPGIVRAYLEHGMQTLPQPVRLYSTGPAFRYEHPQAGRYRQFHQFNLEVIGDGNPVIDAQVIQIFYNILTELKLKKLIIELNSIGDNQCRPYYKKLLTSYFKSRDLALCVDCRRRLKENPLRVLDCKEEKCQRIASQAPQIIDHLCEECHHHFKGVLEFLDEIELPYRLNPYLVRGLDYYTKTVFEIFEDTEEGRKMGALSAGGRYDALVKLLGGEDAKAIGGAMGVERVIAAIKPKGAVAPKSINPPIFLAQLGTMAKRKSLKLLEDFRKVKIPVAESFGRDSLRAQFKIADKLGAKYTLLLGQKEALEGTIIIRDMQTGKQETMKLDKIVREMERRLKK
ncbi:MAG: histidine--tRNA ligase [Candidatus Nealsonbacteria bacterium CG02_land_8_20_14_3_00_37_10]|uniref:Histidine--tRNA ligase n=2 Tax=Candidatus Nealsoniibacteriota TaxID=1817911 RepID=A0A2G9YY51_9BACT|nr:MAG: histidine--tRNA ligase [Candidatus Nealsonbacteria bacterium CG23_combo_of_CG06-09_8_20_14_all_37_18]PIV45130.1 MAG: histidine--tRNA ligase [Candidatus Nealsonbacteria bacterium CG02_land_8_20_14_3_00_37_10]